MHVSQPFCRAPEHPSSDQRSAPRLVVVCSARPCRSPQRSAQVLAPEYNVQDDVVGPELFDVETTYHHGIRNKDMTLYRVTGG